MFGFYGSKSLFRADRHDTSDKCLLYLMGSLITIILISFVSLIHLFSFSALPDHHNPFPDRELDVDRNTGSKSSKDV